MPGALVKDFEDKHVGLTELNPIDAIKLKMKERGLKAMDHELFIGTKGHVSAGTGSDHFINQNNGFECSELE
jgi:antitoxin component HigA of HigAB toxin-antitoxin module